MARDPRPSAGEQHLGADYDTEWTRRYPARFARLVARQRHPPLAHVVASPGGSAATSPRARRGPRIYVANHASHVDTVCCCRCCRPGSATRPWSPPPPTTSSIGAGRRTCGPSSGGHPHRAPSGQPEVRRGHRRAPTPGLEPHHLPRGGPPPDGWFQPMRGVRPIWPRAREGPWCRCTSTAPTAIWPRGGTVCAAARRASPSAR